MGSRAIILIISPVNLKANNQLIGSLDYFRFANKFLTHFFHNPKKKLFGGKKAKNVIKIPNYSINFTKIGINRCCHSISPSFAQLLSEWIRIQMHLGIITSHLFCFCVPRRTSEVNKV
jgi:hypothetical protein